MKERAVAMEKTRSLENLHELRLIQVDPIIRTAVRLK